MHIITGDRETLPTLQDHWRKTIFLMHKLTHLLNLLTTAGEYLVKKTSRQKENERGISFL